MKYIICDFANVILLPRNELYRGGHDKVHAAIRDQGSAFLALNQLNEPLLDMIEELQCKKIVFTAGSAHKAPEITDRVHAVFDAVFTTTQIGYSKSDPEAFKSLCLKLGVEPNNCFFIDDQYPNVQSAQVAGLTAVQYSTVAHAKKAIRNWYDGDTMEQV